MKKSFFTLLFAAFVSFAISQGTVSPAYAGEKVSCEELEKMAAELDSLAEALVDTAIGVDSPLDKALNELLDAIFDFANTEKDAALDDATKNMDKAWHDMDKPSFEAALDQVIHEIDGIAAQDCQ